MLIWLDEQHLPWSDDERAALAEDDDAQWLLGKFPAGVHGRPEGSSGAQSAARPGQPQSRPVRACLSAPYEEPHYGEIALRGMATMVPGLAAYIGKAARPHVDGGYYVKTRDNRPLIGPLPVEGANTSAGAFSGFGVMASCGSWRPSPGIS